jgi:hypothetical protein
LWFKILEAKLSLLLSEAPKVGSVTLEAVFHNGKIVRVILKREEAQLV